MHIKCGEVPVSEMWIYWRSGNLNTDLHRALVLFCSLVHMASVNSGDISRYPAYTCLEPVSPGTGQQLVDVDNTKGGALNMNTIFTNPYHIFVGTNASASRASNYSYSCLPDTMWSRGGVDSLLLLASGCFGKSEALGK